jgi:hypothetical protein
MSGKGNVERGGNQYTWMDDEEQGSGQAIIFMGERDRILARIWPSREHGKIKFMATYVCDDEGMFSEPKDYTTLTNAKKETAFYALTCEIDRQRGMILHAQVKLLDALHTSAQDSADVRTALEILAGMYIQPSFDFTERDVEARLIKAGIEPPVQQ